MNIGGFPTQLIIAICLIVLTVAMIVGVILVAIPLFRWINFQKKSRRPFLTLQINDGNEMQVSNSGLNECIITSIFFTPDNQYFEELNDFELVPQQTIKVHIPESKVENSLIQINYRDPQTKTNFVQKYPIANI